MAGMLEREEGRRLFGQDPAAYEAGRPEYPDVVYQKLKTRCGLVPGARVIEVGPGTGLVTSHLLESGSTVLAIEPDPGLAAHLSTMFGDVLVQILPVTLEAAELPEEAFDLAVAATSFHWVDQEIGLSKLNRALRPGGWIALWWTLYRDPSSPDAFTQGVERILGPETRGAFDEPGRPPFQLDAEHRLRDLERWGHLQDIEAELIKTTSSLDAREVRALYGSMATVLRRTRAEQTMLLDAIDALVCDRFGGWVERQFVTALYAGQKPLAR